MVVMKSILVVTSTPGFGELIQETLEKTGAYRVLLVDSSLEALTCAQNIPFALAILDFDLGDKALLDFARSIKAICENIFLVAIPPDNNLQHPNLAQLPIDGYLSKPFYLPDLLEKITGILDGCSVPVSPVPQDRSISAEHPATKSDENAWDWLQDVNRAAQHLTRLTLESSAQAALIVRQGELWAYAGQFDQLTAQGLAKAVSRLSVDCCQSAARGSAAAVDIVRVVHLETTGGEYLVYITPLTGDAVLAMAFEAATPLSTIRAQANSLARALIAPGESGSKSTSVQLAERPSVHYSYHEMPYFEVMHEDDLVDEQEDVLDDEALPVTLPPLLDDVLPPIPGRSGFPAQDAPRQVGYSLPQPLAGDENSAYLEQEALESQLRPINPTLHSLYYFCLLIPRLPQHHLVGNLPKILTEAMNQVCLAFGWCLDHLSIRPDYCQWIVHVHPATSPSTLMRVVRQKTSRRIFEAMPALRVDNPSGDFWAPGYLIMSGSRLPKAAIIKDFILRTRQYQGLRSPILSKV